MRFSIAQHSKKPCDVSLFVVKSQLLLVHFLGFPGRLLYLPGDVAHRPAHVVGAQHPPIVAHQVLEEVPLGLSAGFIFKKDRREICTNYDELN